MPAPNHVIGELLGEYAELMVLTGSPGFKARAYEKAARSVAGYHLDVSTLDAKQLQEIPNVGKSTADKIAEYFRTGQIAALELLRSKVPRGTSVLMTIPGLGPAKAKMLATDLGITSIEELSAAIEAEKLDGLPGFGAKTIENIKHGIELLSQGGGRVLLPQALELAETFVKALSDVEGCVRCEYAGSLRRMRESIGDVDILAAAADSGPLMRAFAEHPLVAEVIVRGPAKTSIRAVGGLQIDLRVVQPDAWGAALIYFTGSKAHNVRLREIAIHKGLKLSEYGLFKTERGSARASRQEFGQDNELVVSKTEQQVYKRLGMPWIDPHMREDRGEIQAAQRDELPTLVTLEDLQGDLHTHTDLTDGVAPLERMVATARKRGYAYYAVTDHAKNLVMQRMTDAKMLAQREQVRELSAGKMTLLHGSELNIDPLGEVDWDADFLSGFDICVASVHSHFTQSQAEMTRRLIRACENPYVNIIGHLTTRLIGRRPQIDADFNAVFEVAAATGTALEINSHPDRLDINDELILLARRHGCKFAINSDAHSTGHLGHVQFGVGMAQRGWLTADEVINTWPLERLQTFVSDKRS